MTRDDDLDAARGVVYSTPIAVALWSVIAAVLWLAGKVWP